MIPQTINLGFINIHIYSICICISLLLGISLFLKESKKYKLDENKMTNLILGTVIFAIIGARIYYVIFNMSYYHNILEIIKIWEGGLAIHGGIIGGLLWIIYYTRKHKINIYRILDISVVSLIIGQAIGRWGNFFNGEAHGPATSLDFLNSLHLPQIIIDGMNINGIYYQPTFLYESTWCLIGFVILILCRKYTKIKLGQLTSIYLIWYGIGRILIESLRTDSLMLMNLKVAQIISIIMIVFGIVLFWINKNKNNYKEV